MSAFKQKVEADKQAAIQDGVENPHDLRKLIFDKIAPALFGAKLEISRYDASFCYLNISKARKPDLPEEIKLPQGFLTYQPKNRNTIHEMMREYDELSNQRKVVEVDGVSQKTIEDALMMMAPIFDVNSSNKMSSQLYQMTDKLSQTDEAPPKRGIRELDITLKPQPNSVVSAFLPTVDMFPKTVTELNGKDIMTLYPSDAEREAFMMALGSVVVGPKNSRDALTGEVYNHSFRQIIILQGDSKVGKSYVLEKIATEILPLLGYNYSTLPENDFKETFGLARPAQAHISFKDDLDQSTFVRNWLESGPIKTWGAQGFITTQEKNRDSCKTLVNTRIFGCINNLDSNAFIGGDYGVLNRLWMLHHVDKKDARSVNVDHAIAKQSPNKMVNEHVPWLAEKLGVEPETIWIWFLRLCADKFLAEIEREPSLERYSEQLSSKFIYQTNRNTTRSLALAMVFCIRLLSPKLKADSSLGSPKASSIVTGFKAFGSIACSHSTPAHTIKNILKDDWQKLGRPYEHPWTAFRELDFTNVATVVSNIQTAKNTENLVRNNKAKGGNFEKALDETFSGLRTENTGEKVIASPSLFIQYWNEVKNKHYTDLFNKLKPIAADVAEMTADDYALCSLTTYDAKIQADKLNEHTSIH